MKILIKNAKIMTHSHADIFDGEIVVNNNKIEYVGRKSNVTCDSEIDAGGNLVMAGFINCHAHSAMTVLKGFGEGENLENWLTKHIFPKEEHITKQSVYYATLLAIAEYVKNGITAFQDNYYMVEETARACINSGMRAVISLSQNLTPSKLAKIEEVEKLYKKLSGQSDLVTYNFYCHATYTCDENMYSNIARLAKKYNTFVATHASETLTEVGECTVKNNGLSPVGLLQSYGFFDQKSLIAHGVYLEKEDLNILEKSDVSVAHNPASNLKLGSGIANINALMKRGINVCLGTDGSASNNRLDMFREMYLASVLQKAAFKDASLMKPSEVLQMATENGAKALGLQDVGSLKAGNKADLIIVDLNGVNNASSLDIKSNLVYASGTEDILLTMIDGKVMYERGVYHLGEDIEKIKEICRKTVLRLKDY